MYIKNDAVIVPAGGVVDVIEKSSVARQQILAPTNKSQGITIVSPDFTPIFAIGIFVSVADANAYNFK